jgi:chaperonin GroES
MEYADGGWNHNYQKQNLDYMAKTKLTIRPLADRVIVQPAAAETMTKGGIIIPDTAKEKPQKGTIVAAGPGKKDEPVTVKVGDSVLYGKYSGTEINIDGVEYLIMRESDIFAIL